MVDKGIEDIETVCAVVAGLFDPKSNVPGSS